MVEKKLEGIPDKPARTVAASAPPDRPARRVLVVDDNADARDALAMLLRLRGYEVAVAHDGAAAMDLVAATAPDAVLLDIGLPGQNGYDVAKSLREQPGMADALVVAITGYAGEEVEARAKAARFDHCLTKPVDLEVVVALLERNGVRREP